MLILAKKLRIMPKVSISVPEAVMEVWNKEITNQSELCRAAKISRPCLVSAIKTGRCTESTMLKINKYLLKKRKIKNLTIQQLCQD